MKEGDAMNKKLIAEIELLKKQGKTTAEISEIIFDKWGLFEHVTAALIMFAN